MNWFVRGGPEDHLSPPGGIALLAVAAVTMFLVPALVGAEESSVESEPPTEDSDVETEIDDPSPEELAEIEAALAADEEARDDGADEGGGADEEPSQPRSAVGRALQSLNPDLSFIADIALAWFSTDDHLQTGGHDPTSNGFNLQQLELSVSAAVDPYFRFDANLVFSLFGVEIEEAYATTLGLPGRLQLRLGQFLTRFGRINPTHPHSWEFVDQPFAVGRVFGGEGNRGLGLELSWLTPLPWYVEILGSATSAAGASTNRSFFGGQDLGIDSLDDFLYVVAIKQFFALSDDWSLYWGISAAFGPNGTGRDNASEIYATDIYLKWRPIDGASYQVFSLQTEWFYRRRQIPGDVLQDVSGYAQVYWRFAQRWAAAARYEYGSPPWDAGGDTAEGDYLDPLWLDHRHRVTVNATFWPTEFSRFRLQGSVDIPRWQDDPVWAAMLAAEFVTGAHGAHEF